MKKRNHCDRDRLTLSKEMVGGSRSKNERRKKAKERRKKKIRRKGSGPHGIKK